MFKIVAHIKGDESVREIYPNLALLGCGTMGRLLGHRLLRHGYPVTIYNRTPSKTNELVQAGASLAPDPRTAAQNAKTAIIAVSDDHALHSVLHDPDGALSGPLTPSLIIVLGTHNPHVIIDLARVLKERGVSLIDAPMSGSVHDAQHGTLGFLVGARLDDLARARPVLAAMGNEIWHFGLPGTGSCAKLALNLLVGAMACSLGESFAILEKQHLDVAKFLSALDKSGLKSPLYQRLGERYLQGDVSARFSLANLEKDIQLVSAHAKSLGVSHIMADAVMHPLREMNEADKKLDYSTLLSWSVRRS